MQTHESALSRGSEIHCLGWLGLAQLCLEPAVTTVTPQDLDGLLLHGGWDDAQVLQTGKPRVPHICGVELMGKRNINQPGNSQETYFEREEIHPDANTVEKLPADLAEPAENGWYLVH